jgi:hypothetical protein
MLQVMDLQMRSNIRPDGALRRRVDGTGTQVAVLPATCKLGLHVLQPAECSAIVVDDEVHVSCPACAATPGTDHRWRLTVNGTCPIRAELDDEPYLDLRLPRSPAPQ